MLDLGPRLGAIVHELLTAPAPVAQVFWRRCFWPTASAVSQQLRSPVSVRVYYLDLPRRGVTHLVAIFGKREKGDLSPTERKAVAALAKRLKEES